MKDVERNKNNNVAKKILVLVILLLVIIFFALAYGKTNKNNDKKDFDKNLRIIEKKIKKEIGKSNYIKDSKGCYVFELPNDKYKFLNTDDLKKYSGTIKYCNGKFIYENFSNGKYSITTDKNGKKEVISVNKAKKMDSNYTVTFINDDKEYMKVRVNDDKLVLQPEAPSKEGYKFKYWSLSKNGKEYNFNLTIKSNLKLYAVYEKVENPVQKYTILFKDDDGTILQRQVLEYGKIPVFKGTLPSKKGNFVFNGWDKVISRVTKNEIYRATYISTEKEYDEELLLSNNIFTLYKLQDEINIKGTKIIDDKVYSIIPIKIKEKKVTKKLTLKDLKDYKLTINNMDIAGKISVVGFNADGNISLDDNETIENIGIAVLDTNIIDDINNYGVKVTYTKTDKSVKEGLIKIYVCEVPRIESVIYEENLKLKDIDLPITWEWDRPDTKLKATDENGVLYSVTHLTRNGNKIKLNLPVYVEKADPVYTVPTNLNATYGDSLSDVTLPSGFSFEDDEVTYVGNAGENEFYVTYTPVDTKNYNIINNISVIIEVSKKELNIITPDFEKIYDGVALTYEEGASITGFANDEDATLVIDGTITDVGEADNSYHIEWTTDKLDKVAADESNYIISEVVGKLKITPFTDKITVTITENSDTVLYDGIEHKVTGYKVTNIDNALFNINNITFIGNAEVKGTDSGTYDMELLPSDFSNNNPNFTNVEFVIVDGSLVIEKRNVTLTSSSDTKVYDSIPLTNDTITISEDGFALGEGVDNYTVTGTQIDVGTSINEFDYVLKDNTNINNYNITKVEGTLEVIPVTDKVTVTIKENSKTVTYNGTEQSVSNYTISNISNNLYKESDITFTGNAEVKGTNAGTYNMELLPSDFSNNNPNFTNVEFIIVDGSLVIEKRNVTLTSNSKTRVYNGTALTDTGVVVSSAGFASGEGVDNYTVTGTQTDAGTTSNTFSYTLKNNTNIDNYNITKVEGTLKVTPVTDKVTVTIKENSKTVTYNGTEQSLSGYTISNISNNLYKESDIAFTGNAQAKGTNVGTYNIELLPSNFSNKNTNNFTNVEFVIVDGKLIIDYKAVTVTANNASKYVGDSADPTLTATVSGTIGSDTISYSISRTAGTATGYYDIIPSGNNTQGNYSVTYVKGKFTIYNKITYNLDGGSFSSTPWYTYTKEDTYDLPVPTKSGYVFLGWKGSNGSTPQHNVVLDKTTGDKSYTATWAHALQGDLRTFSATDTTVSYTYDSSSKTYSVKQLSGSTGWGQGVICDGAQTAIPWGHTYILQLSLYVPVDSFLSLDTNAMFSDGTGNDIYGSSQFYIDGVKMSSQGNLISSNKWVTATLYMTNNNESENPMHQTIYSYSSFGFNLVGKSDLSYKVKDLVVASVDLR